MLTADELATIALFAKLPAAELEQLASRAADVQLGAGEYAVHEGEERALFAVVGGKIEVTKQFDGVERTIGWRAPGQIFGEASARVPVTVPRAAKRATRRASTCT